MAQKVATAHKMKFRQKTSFPSKIPTVTSRPRMSQLNPDTSDFKRDPPPTPTPTPSGPQKLCTGYNPITNLQEILSFTTECKHVKLVCENH